VFRHVRVQGPEAAEDHAQKKTKRFKEQKAELAEGYLAELENVSGRPIVYVDETGIDPASAASTGGRRAASP